MIFKPYQYVSAFNVATNRVACIASSQCGVSSHISNTAFILDSEIILAAISGPISFPVAIPFQAPSFPRFACLDLYLLV